MNVRIRVAVVIIEEGRLLLVQHYKGGRRYWLLPGGGLEYGETIAECARREVKEETNLDVEIGDLIFVSESIPPDRHRHVVNLYYEGKLLGGKLKVGEDYILEDVKFFDVDSIESLTIYPNITKELLDYIKSGVRQKISLGNRWD